MPLKNPADEININFGVSPGISIVCNSPEVPCDERNLCHKAAAGYAEAADIAPEWEISIDKNIPVAAGMGGGSSNAATVLRVLNEKYRKLTHAELTSIALHCGADVPFFLSPRPALASGVGNIFEYPENNFPEIPLLLINPGFPVSAAWAYKNMSQESIVELRNGYEQDFLNALEKADLKKLSELIINDLAVACYKKFPLLEILRTELLESGAAAAEVTGSGPTLFALFENVEKRDRSADSFKQNYPQMTVVKSSL